MYNHVYIFSSLCHYLYPTSLRIRTRAMLCHIYHHSIHDRWYQARDLMLMSHLQEAIQFADVLTMVSALHMLSTPQNGS